MAREIDEAEAGENVTETTETTEAAEQATEDKAEEQAETGTQASSTTEQTEGATASTDEAKAEPAGPSDKELFELFENAAKAALEDEGRDEGTGTLPAAAIVPVQTAYAALGTRYKGNARDWLTERMTEAMTEGAYVDARSYLELLNGLKTGVKKETVQKQPVDPTEAHVARATALMLSVNLLSAEEGVAEDWAAQAQAKANELGPQVLEYQKWLFANDGKPSDEQTEAPQVDPIVLAAAAAAKGRAVTRKAATGTSPAKPKATGESSGVRRDTAAHIIEAFAEKPSGTWLSIGEIVKFKSTEYGDTEPSPGAIAARLFPGNDASKCKVPGIRAEQRDKKGAVKL